MASDEEFYQFASSVWNDCDPNPSFYSVLSRSLTDQAGSVSVFMSPEISLVPYESYWGSSH